MPGAVLGLSAQVALDDNGFQRRCDCMPGIWTPASEAGFASLIRTGIFFFHPTQNLHNWEGGYDMAPPHRLCVLQALLLLSLAHFKSKGEMNRFEFFEINYHPCHGKCIWGLPSGVERGGGGRSHAERSPGRWHMSPRCTPKAKPHPSHDLASWSSEHLLVGSEHSSEFFF